MAKKKKIPYRYLIYLAVAVLGYYYSLAVPGQFLGLLLILFAIEYRYFIRK